MTEFKLFWAKNGIVGVSLIKLIFLPGRRFIHVLFSWLRGNHGFELRAFLFYGESLFDRTKITRKMFSKNKDFKSGSPTRGVLKSYPLHLFQNRNSPV